MAEIVAMPKLGLLMETGTVGAWRVAEGDHVEVGQVIVEITTEKITYELESQVEGTLLKILQPEDEEAPVGDPIAVIGLPGEDISAFTGTGATAPAPVPVAPEKVPTPLHAPGERVVASPAAKKLAAELGVDLAFVLGNGPGGRITMDDVASAHAVSTATPAVPTGAEVFATPTARKMAADLRVDLAGIAGSGTSGRVKAADVAHAAAPAAAPPTAAGIRGGVLEEIPYTGMRRLIGEHMDQSRTLAPTVTYCGTADVQKLKDLIAQINVVRTEDDKVNLTAATIKAAALTLERMPRFNSTLEDGVIRVWRSINIGVAVALKDGLIVPVVKEAGRKRLSEIAREVKELAARARDSTLLPDDVSGGTFTVSTLGAYRSVDFFNPIINQPESAILGVGRMQDSVVPVNGQPAIHATMGLALTCDHRVIDGAPAAEFLRILMDYLAEPLSMLV